MGTVFLREGKTISYYEVVELLERIISEDILASLDEQQVQSFYVRLFTATYTSIATYLESRGYKIINERQGLLTAYKTKIIEDKAVWDQLLQVSKSFGEVEKADVEEEYLIQSKEEVISFIEEKVYPAIKKLQNKIS